VVLAGIIAIVGAAPVSFAQDEPTDLPAPIEEPTTPADEPAAASEEPVILEAVIAAIEEFLLPEEWLDPEFPIEFDEPVSEEEPPPGLPLYPVHTQSSPIMLSFNQDRLVNVNPDQDTISLFDPSTPSPTKLAEIGVGAEPNSVTIHPDNTTAYVANAVSGTVSVVNLTTQLTTSTIPVGAEPRALALSPNGTRLYVTNHSSNSLSVFNTSAPATPAPVATVDLSAFGTAPGAIAVSTDFDGDDSDETVFVAMFFGQLRAGKGAVHEGQDDQRQGHVVAISAATNTVLAAPNPIVLGPIANAGFNANGQLAPGPGQVPAVASTNPQTFTTPTGAYPNQLAAIALHPFDGRGYVVATAASPNGPLRFNHMAQGLVSVFNRSTRLEVTSGQTAALVRQTAPLNLNQGVNLGTTPAPRLFLTNPVAMAWSPSGSDAWVVIQNGNLLVRLTADGNGIPTVNNPLVAGPSTLVRVDLENPPGGLLAGKAPRGIVLNDIGSRAFVFNYVSRSITAVNLNNPLAPVIVGTAQASALPVPGTSAFTVQQGAALFFTGRGPQERMSSENWGGCIVCHPLGGRSDNVTWMFDAGPRQTIPLDGMFDPNNLADQRILNWSAVRDENHDFELNTRGVFGGRGLVDDDRLTLAIGGAAGATPADTALIEQFNNATGVVSTNNDLRLSTPLPTLAAFGARRDFAIATLGDGRVFLIGGRSGAGQGSLVTGANTVLEFNPRTNLIRTRSNAGFTPRHSFGAAAVKTSGGPRIYAIGGYASTGTSAAPVATVQEYNPATNIWRTVASLPTAVAEFGITAAGGVNTAEPLELIHVVSGNNGSESSPSLAIPAVVQRYQADPVGPGVWSTFTPTGLNARRQHGAATALRGVQSRIFIIGGRDGLGTVTSAVEEYLAQAVTAVLTPHTPMPAPRARFGIASTLTTNQIYAIGGIDSGGTDQTTIFEYTVANNGPVAGPTGTPSGTWVTRGNLSGARSGLGLSNPPGVTNFLTVRNSGRNADQDAIAVWVARALRSARPPVLATDPSAQAGRTLFGTTGLVVAGFSCATCHGGPKWTRSTRDYVAPPSPTDNVGLGNQNVIGAELRKTALQPAVFPGVLVNVGTFTLGGGRTNEIRFNGADISQAINPLGANGFNIPSLLSVHETAPYYYSGLAQTLAQVLDGSQDGNGGVRHHFVTNAAQRAQLIAFLRSIDESTPIFP
jgi:YVTN family beta-propeller protein